MKVENGAQPGLEAHWETPYTYVRKLMCSPPPAEGSVTVGLQYGLGERFLQELAIAGDAARARMREVAAEVFQRLPALTELRIEYCGEFLVFHADDFGD
jgi:hypothetical protein